MGNWEADTCAPGLAVLQAIGFFTSDTHYLFEGVYYGPLIFTSFLSLTFCSVTSYLMLGSTVFVATVGYLLVFLLTVMLGMPQNPRGSVIGGASEWDHRLLQTVYPTVGKLQLPFLPQTGLWPQPWPHELEVNLLCEGPL